MPRSIVHNMPMAFLEGMRTFYRDTLGLKIRVRYRGPSTVFYRRPKAHCVKAHATHFAIYTR